MSTNNTTNNGGGAMFLLFLTFMILKLCKVITWSWWWITAPLWGGVAIFLGIVIIVAIAGLIYRLFTK